MKAVHKGYKLFKAQMFVKQDVLEEAGSSLKRYLEDSTPSVCDCYGAIQATSDLGELLDIIGLSVISDENNNMTGFKSKTSKGLHQSFIASNSINFFSPDYMGKWIEGAGEIEVGEDDYENSVYKVMLVIFKNGEIKIEHYSKPVDDESELVDEVEEEHPAILAAFEEKASLKDINKIFSAIHEYLTNKEFNKAKEIISKGCDFYSTNNFGETLLDHCLDLELDAIKFLVEDIGLDANKGDEKGWTSLYKLRKYFDVSPEKKEIHAYLVSMGATANPNLLESGWV